MPTISAVGSKIETLYGQASKVLWETCLNNDVGAAVGNTQYADRSVQVIGTFGGATVTMQGSNDGGTTWSTLNDGAGTPLTFTAAGIKQVLEVSQKIRPSIAGGGGTTDLDVHLVMVARG